MITKATHKQIGNFKQYADFRYEDGQDDGMGGGFPEWQTLFSAWVNIKPVSGSQRLQLDSIESNVTHIVEARFRDDLEQLGYDKPRIDNHLQMRYQGRLFNIQYALNEGEENFYYELAASEQL